MISNCYFYYIDSQHLTSPVRKGSLLSHKSMSNISDDRLI